MSAVQIACTGLSPMLEDLLGGILENEPEFHVALRAAFDAGALADALDPIDVLLVGASSTRGAAAYWDLIERHPRLRIIEISLNGRDLSLFELRPHRQHLGDVSPGQLTSLLHRRRGTDRPC